MINKELLEFLKLLFLELSKILGYMLIYSAITLLLICGLGIIVITSKNMLDKRITIKFPKSLTVFISKVGKKLRTMFEYLLCIYATSCILYAIWDMIKKYILN